MRRLAALLLLAGLAACGPSDAEQADACAQGVPAADLGPGQCQFVSNGRCFDDPALACVCEGCSSSQCSIGESAPAVLLCD